MYSYTHKNIEALKAQKGSAHFDIPELNANFEVELDYEVTGTKGDPSAKYTFTTLLGRQFNVRAKFRLTDPLINEGSNRYDIASVAGVPAYASVTPLSQYVKGRSINNVSRYSYYSTVNGGVTFNGSSQTDDDHNLNIGCYAFSIQYTGSNQTATIEVTSSALILIDSETHTFTFTNYATMYELYSALKQLTDYDVVYNALENHIPSDLAIISQCSLINTCYINDESVNTKAPFFVPYALDNRWHQLEIVGIGNYVYSVVDGITLSTSRSFDSSTEQYIIFGGDCGVLFKDVTIDIASAMDAEVIGPANEGTRLISSVNPYIIIYEGHNMFAVPNDEIDSTYTMATSSDRIQMLADRARSLGYIPVSVGDIIDYFDGKRSLPKRCYTLIFDDYRFENYLVHKNRSAFTRNGLKPALAVITSNDATITYNNETITIQEAIEIGKNSGFSFYSHTANHSDLERSVSPDNMLALLSECIIDADVKHVDGNVIIYPSGHTCRYVMDCMRFLGFKCAINVDHNTSVLNANNDKYNLTRRELGIREPLNDFLATLV